MWEWQVNVPDAQVEVCRVLSKQGEDTGLGLEGRVQVQPWKNRDDPVGWERQRVLGCRPGKENSEQGIVWQHSCVPSWGRQGSKHFTATRRHSPTNPQSAVPPTPSRMMEFRAAALSVP